MVRETRYAPYDRWGEASELPLASRIYVNRNLKMSSVRAIGFDLDHTLAFYRPLAIERLAFDETKKKLVSDFGFPEKVLALRYNPQFIIRGLVVDRRRGNLIKMDSHNYVTRAFHGTRPLPDEERRRIYARRRLRITSEAYAPVDTLFHLPEAYLYQRLVDLGDQGVGGITEDYGELYNQVRTSIDRAHADGSIKAVVTGEPGRFLRADRSLAPTFERFRESGKKLFLLTNSDLAYTEVVMSLVFGERSGLFDDWKDAFDVVLVDAAKPGFFLETPTAEDRGHMQEAWRFGTRILTGGNAAGLERELDSFGDEILYFGDHTFGDILKSKKFFGWRTAMVVPELKRELRVTQRITGSLAELLELNRKLDYLRVERGRLEKKERRTKPGSTRRVDRTSGARRRLAQQWADLVLDLEALAEKCDRAYNSYWGSLFHEGRERSYFGHQVKDFACIYTARVSNFRHYPVGHYFQAPGDIMPHEL